MHDHVKAALHAVIAIGGAVVSFWPYIMAALQFGGAAVAIFSGICAARYYLKAASKLQ